MNDSADRFRNFAARLLEHEGALVESIEPQGLEAMLPENLRRALGAPEFLRLGFGPEAPAGAERASLESDWLEKVGRLLDERGRCLRFAADAAVPTLAHMERTVEHNVVLQNAVYRLSQIEQAWTRYLIFIFRYIAISDEKREGIVKFGINLINGSAIDPMIDQLLTSAMEESASETVTKPVAAQLPADWTAEKLKQAVTRAAPARIRANLAQFVNGMQRRLDRDLERLYEYFGGLREESWRKLKRQKGDGERERLRIEAAEREYLAKVADLKQKYDLRVRIEPVQTLELISQVKRVELIVKRRKGERKLALDWNPIARQLDPLPCEWSFTAEGSRVVCDDQLHIVSQEGHGPCPQCGREYCRACSPRRCPKCGKEMKKPEDFTG
ncbi:MAG: zinc ribbon domain-containing protein [Blastocatellia bacterium]|nr:zinc ribbon domain-containing protein [Blastocatellia bacterium]